MEPALSVWKRRAGDAWIAGTNAAEFRAAINSQAARFVATPRGVVHVESDPLAFVAGLIAALTSERPVQLFLGSPLWSGQERSSAAVAAADDSLCALDRTHLFVPTGGTSGGLRFAAHTWETLAAAALGLQSWLGGGPIHSVCFLPLHHVSGLMQVIRSFVSGGELALARWPAIDSGSFPHRARRPAVTSLVPTQLARLIATPAAVGWLRDFRAVFLGGAPAWPELLAQARSLRIPLAPCYGMTETAAQITALRPEQFLAGRDDVGAPLPHARVGIVDAKSAAPASPDSVGPIRVEAASLFCGYHPDVGAPRTGFVTDDYGSIRGDGGLVVLGRSDEVIITGGEKVNPAEVEAAIRATGFVRDVAVCGAADSEWGEQVVALLVEFDPARAAQLADRLRAQLPRYKIPKRFLVVGELPRTSAGKIDREAVRQLASSAR